MPRLVYIHQYFKTPEDQGSTRSFHLASALAAQGVEVVVVTAGSHAKDYVVSGVRVIVLQVEYSNSMSVWERLLAFVRFYFKAKQTVQRLKPDFIYATSTPLSVGSIGRSAAKKLGIPYIFEVRDLWPDFPIQTGVLKWPFSSLMKWEEKRIYSSAKAVVALSDDMLQAVQSRTSTPAVCIPNFSFLKPIPHLQKSLKIAYLGSLGRFNGIEYWENLLRTADELRVDLELHVWGEGYHEKTVKDLPMVVYHGTVPKKNVQQAIVESGCSFSLISFSDLPVLQTNAPNKLADSLKMQLPIITTTKGWMEAVSRSGCGLHWEFGKEDQLIRALIGADIEAMRNQCAVTSEAFDGTKVVADWIAFIKPYLG